MLGILWMEFSVDFSPFKNQAVQGHNMGNDMKVLGGG